MKYFFDYHRSGCAAQVPGMPLYLVAQGGKLSVDNYLKAINLGSIIRMQFSGWHLFCGNYQFLIILWGNSLNRPYPRANYPGGNNPEGNYPGGNYLGNCLGGNCPGVIILGGIIRGAIVWGSINLGGQLSGEKSSVGQLSGDNYPGCNCPRTNTNVLFFHVLTKKS